MAAKIIKVVITADGKQYALEIDKTTGKTKKLSNATRNLRSHFNFLNRDILTLRNSLGLLAAGFVTKEIIQAGIQMQRIDNQLLAVSGSSALAAQELAFVRQEADRLGLDFVNAADSYAKLTAASKDTSLQGRATRKIFTAISEAARALTLSTDSTKGTFRAIEQMMSKGNVQAEELRGQLGERLPGAFQISARAMGVTTQELNKMLDRGEVLADELLPALAVELRKTFGSNLDVAMASTDAELNRLKNSVFDLKTSLSKNLLPTFTKFVSFLGNEAIPAFALMAERMGLLERDINKFSLGEAALEVELINEKIEKHNKLLITSKEGTGAFAFHQEKLNTLIEKRKALVAKVVQLQEQLRDANKPQGGASKGGADSGPSKEMILLNAQAEKYLGSLHRQTELLGETTAAAKIRFELEHGMFKDLDEDVKAQIRIRGVLLDNRQQEIDAVKKHTEAEKERLKLLDEQKKDEEELFGILSKQHSERIKNTNERLEALRKSLKSEVQLLEDRYKKEQEFLEDARRNGFVTEEEFAQLRVDLELKTDSEIAEIHKRQLGKLNEESKDSFKELEDAIRGYGDEFTDVFVEMTKTGKFEFSSLVDSIITDLLRMQVQESITNQLFGFLTGTISNLFSPDTSELGAIDDSLFSEVLHSGGIAGRGGVQRSVPLRVFDDAPRFHKGGLVPGEVPAVLRRGEGVFTPEQMQALGGGGVNIVVNNNASGATATAVDRGFSNGQQQIEILVEDAFEKNMSAGRHDKSFRSQFNISRSGVRS